MGSKYMIYYRNYDDIALSDKQTNHLLIALLYLIRLLPKYELINFEIRK